MAMTLRNRWSCGNSIMNAYATMPPIEWPIQCTCECPVTSWMRAIAAGLAHPQKEVLCYYGDGAFSMTAFDMETANRFKVPYIAVVGNNSAMNQIRYGQLAKYGPERGNVGNLLGDVPFGKFAEMLGG